MGRRIFDASNWQVSEEQKNHFVDFGLNKLELAEEQREVLVGIHPDQFKSFSLTSHVPELSSAIPETGIKPLGLLSAPGTPGPSDGGSYYGPGGRRLPLKYGEQFSFSAFIK